MCHTSRYQLTMMVQTGSGNAAARACPSKWTGIGYKVYGTGSTATVYQVCAR